MPTKITLITPPDIYQNNKLSIFLIDVTDAEQDEISAWLANNNLDIDINIYFYQGESNPTWFFHCLMASKYTYINLDNASFMGERLASYALSISDTYYYTSNNELEHIYKHMNNGKVDNVIQFLEKVFDGKE